MALDIVRLMLFPALMAFAAMTDLFTMTISNKVSLLLIAGFVMLAPFAGMGMQEILLHVAAAAVVLAVTFVCFAQGWIGGGDAKLASAIALWLGFSHVLDYLLYAAMFGGVLTILVIGLRRRPLPSFANSQLWLQRLHDSKNGVPYGIALALGAMMIYPHTDWMKAIDLSRFVG